MLDPVKKYYEPHPDPPTTKKPDLILVTHGHTDHSNDIWAHAGTRKIMHPATAEILRLRYRYIKDVIPLQRMIKPGEIEDVYKSIKFKDVKIEACNAGHVIGSVQFKITTGEETLVFTGDINSEGTMVMRPAPVLEADILAIEATAASPALVTPSRQEAFRAMHDFIQRSFSDGHDMIVFFGNPIGKGQEITAMVNSLGGEWKFIVENRTFVMNGIHEKYMIPLGNYTSVKTMKNGSKKKKIVFLDVNKLAGSNITGAKLFKLDHEPPSMIVSIFGHEYDKMFDLLKLSSHDDWNDLNKYVNQSVKKNSGRIATFHGFSKDFARHLRGNGFDAIDSHEEILST